MVLCAITAGDREPVRLTPCRSLRIQRDCNLLLYPDHLHTQSIAMADYLADGYARLDIAGPLRLARLAAEPSMEAPVELHSKLWFSDRALHADGGVIARLTGEGEWRDPVTDTAYESFLVIYAGK